MSEENKKDFFEEDSKESDMNEKAEGVTASADGAENDPDSKWIADINGELGAVAPDGIEDKADEDGDGPRKSPKKISLSAFLFSCVALILATFMITFTCCNGFYRQKIAQIQTENAISGVTQNPDDLVSMLETLSAVFEAYSITGYDGENMMNAVLKAYVRASGDKYAEYYTPEEYSAMLSDNTGKSQGIGINIIESSIVSNGTEFVTIKVINVTKGSPAEEAGVQVNDQIAYVGLGEDKKLVDSYGYLAAVNALQGEAGTEAKFVVLRDNGNGGYEEKEFTILRKEFTSTAIFDRVCSFDSSIGIVKIDSFDLTTPIAFKEAVVSLQNSGCTKFVFDVRYNPGGDLKSIEAVLSYFLNEGDTIIKMVDKNGTEAVSTVKPVTYDGDYASCNVSAEDIGIFRNLNFVVLCNGNTASAAELFTAALRDYDLGTIVGTTTYGKGSVQSIIALRGGLSGAVKLTTRMYYPPCNVSYEGIGIAPDVTVELSEEAQKYNVYDLPDSIDNQLTEAVKHFK